MSFRNTLSVFYAKAFKQPGALTFIPLKRIQSRFIAMNTKHENVDVIIVCALRPSDSLCLKHLLFVFFLTSSWQYELTVQILRGLQKLI